MTIQNDGTDEFVTNTIRGIQWLAMGYKNGMQRAGHIRAYGNALAAAVAAFYTDRDEVKLRAAYERWMTQDAGNFSDWQSVAVQDGRFTP